MTADELTPQERAALVGLCVGQHGRISRAEVMHLTGLTEDGATHLLERLSRCLPVYYDPRLHAWLVCGRE